MTSRQQGDVLAKCGGMVVDREEPNSAPVRLSQLFVGHSGEAALGVLHDDDGVDPEHLARQRQAAQDVIGDSAAGIANDVGLTQDAARARRTHRYGHPCT